MFLLLPLVSHMELGPAGQFIKELLMRKEAQQAALHYPLAWNPWRRHPLAYGVEYPMQENPLLIILHS